MEAAATASVIHSSVAAFRPSNSVSRSSLLMASVPKFLPLGPLGIKSNSSIKQHHQLSNSAARLGFGRRRCLVVKAALSSPDSASSSAPIAPLQLESPVGQFLSHMMISHRHLVPTAVEQQLKQLQTEQDASKKKKEASAAGTDLVLYQRIAEVKANERKKAVADILYALVVQKFMDADVSLVPSIAPAASDPSGRVDTWPSQDEKLMLLHSPEAYEMIQNHLSLVLGNRLDDSTSLAHINKFKVRKVYESSVMYGYFLKRVDQRFQLEKTMKILPGLLTEDDNDIQKGMGEDKRAFEVFTWSANMGSGTSFGNLIRPSRLRTYVMPLDGEILQRYARIRSREAVRIIEKHTETLFGRPPEIVITPQGTVDVEYIKISFGGLKGLVLEAVTFGSFLWDVESYVDSRYHFVTN